MQFLLDCGAEVNIQETNGRTPLHWASFFGYEVVAKLLLDFGADHELQDTAQLTPVAIAHSRKHSKAIEMFDSHLASVQALWEGADVSLI